MSLTSDNVMCGELERTITVMLDAIPDEEVEGSVSFSLSFFFVVEHLTDIRHKLYRLCKQLFDSVKDRVFQGRILQHILPTSGWISLLRCRIAIAFLTSDMGPLTEPQETLFDLRRITAVLVGDQRFNIKAYKMKRNNQYDYEELAATTTLLNVAINPWTNKSEAVFNQDVDQLADRIKRIFTSIEDSGASHLRRTQAKEELEALHYRIVYSVRTKPPPKKSIFGVFESGGGWQGDHRTASFLDGFLSRAKVTNG